MRAPILFAILLAGTSPALAQQPAFNWSGFYLGAHAGYGWGTTDHLGNDVSFTTDGLLAGGQAGINRQIGNFVFGIEADISGTDINSAVGPSHIDYMGTARLRLSITLNVDEDIVRAMAQALAHEMERLDPC